MNTKVRLVRCPRCREVLPELADVPVYKCGGCGAVLQAKNRKKDTKDTVSPLQETDPTKRNEVKHVAEDKEASGLTQQTTIPSTEESVLDKSIETDQNKFGDCKKEQHGSVTHSDELPCSTDELPSSNQLTYHENAESSPKAGAGGEDNCSLDQYDKRDQNEEQPGDLNFSNEVSSSTELNRHDIEPLSAGAGAHIEVDKSPETDQNEYSDCKKEWPGGVNHSEEIPCSNELICHENAESSPQVMTHMKADEDKCPLDQYDRRDQNEFGDDNTEQPRDINFSNEVSSSTELNHHEIEPPAPGVGVRTEVDRSSETDQNEFGDCKKERPWGVNHSGEIPSSTDELPDSTELIFHNNAESSPQGIAHMEVNEDSGALDQYDRRVQNEIGDDNREQPGGINVSNEVSSFTQLNCHESGSLSPRSGAHMEVDKSKYSLEQNNGCDQNEFGDCSRESPGNIKFSMEVSSSTEFTCYEIEQPSQVTEEDNDVHEDLKSRFIFRSSSAENLLDTRPMDSIITAQRPLGESVLSDNLTSPYKEKMKQSQNSIHQGFDHASSVDTLDNVPLIDPSSELYATLGDTSKSPTTRSYYAYDGSASSCNETDDQVPNWHFHLSKRNSRDADFVHTKEFPKRGEFMSSNMMSSELEMQYRAMHSSSILPGKKHHATRGSKWHRDEFPAPLRHGHPVRSMMRLETDEHLSRLPLYPRSSQAGHRHGSPSSYGHKKVECSSSYHSPDKPEYTESDKRELLKMVQDQFNRKYISKGKANGRFPATVAEKGKHNSSYYDNWAPEREIFPDLNYPRYTGRYNQGKSWSQPREISQMAFSGEDTHCRHQVDSSCLHCCPQEWHCSAQLPPCGICCNKGHYTAQPGHNCYSPHHSGPSSPRHFTGSEFSLWSDDQQHIDREVKKLYLREKHHLRKQHFLPIAGGAPIIACYQCSKLLQLPSDFLLFRRRCHRLKCSACSEVLKFSLHHGTHVLPYVPDTIAPPPSEADDYPVAINMRNLASTSHDSTHAEPVSCSDDYGQSLGKSCSTDVDSFSLTPTFCTLDRNSNDRKMSSGSSFEPMEERQKSVLTESHKKYKNPVETIDSARPLSKMSKREKPSSEIEERPPMTGSPLHQLMGYSSPSKVIRG